MSSKYTLYGHTPMPASDLLAWAKSFETTNRIVQQTYLPNDVRVSTVFLGLDHRFGDNGPPLVFETMIFGGPQDSYQERYSTWEEAEAGHDRAVQLAVQETPA